MYFYLTVFWGDVPWVGEVIQPEDAYIERTPREKVIRPARRGFEMGGGAYA